jgi:hypothetical protein
MYAITSGTLAEERVRDMMGEAAAAGRARQAREARRARRGRDGRARHEITVRRPSVRHA